MLSLSDTDLTKFIPIFASTGAGVAFLVPTPTGFQKSIMDATSPLRALLRSSGIHDYAVQLQGPENKAKVRAFFVNETSVKATEASLYRPITKKGDPRIWFYDLKSYCVPCNLLAIVVIENALYVFNLSNNRISDSLMNYGFCYSILQEVRHKESVIANELLHRLKIIHNKGFIPSITCGDPGVGDTLENELGIKRNNNKAPDYKGIELKTTRMTRDGKRRSKTRATLFARVPDIGLTYREIVDKYGKVQVPRNSDVARLQLYETLRCSRPNAYDLVIEVNKQKDEIDLLFQKDDLQREFASAWLLPNLRDAIMQKHRETFWIKALSQTIDGIEYFRYEKLVHTKKPNVSLLEALFDTDKITIDLAAHYRPDGKWRDHGALFKMYPEDLGLLLGESTEYEL